MGSPRIYGLRRIYNEPKRVVYYDRTGNRDDYGISRCGPSQWIRRLGPIRSKCIHPYSVIYIFQCDYTFDWESVFP